MARCVEPSAAEEAGWKEWVASRPANVRAVAERFEPWSLYSMGRYRVTIASFGEEADDTVTLTVNIGGEFNQVLFERYAFDGDGNMIKGQLGRVLTIWADANPGVPLAL